MHLPILFLGGCRASPIIQCIYNCVTQNISVPVPVLYTHSVHNYTSKGVEGMGLFAVGGAMT